MAPYHDDVMHWHSVLSLTAYQSHYYETGGYADTWDLTTFNVIPDVPFGTLMVNFEYALLSLSPNSCFITNHI